MAKKSIFRVRRRKWIKKTNGENNCDQNNKAENNNAENNKAENNKAENIKTEEIANTSPSIMSKTFSTFGNFLNQYYTSKKLKEIDVFSKKKKKLRKINLTLLFFFKNKIIEDSTLGFRVAHWIMHFENKYLEKLKKNLKEVNDTENDLFINFLKMIVPKHENLLASAEKIQEKQRDLDISSLLEQQLYLSNSYSLVMKNLEKLLEKQNNKDLTESNALKDASEYLMKYFVFFNSLVNNCEKNVSFYDLFYEIHKELLQCYSFSINTRISQQTKEEMGISNHCFKLKDVTVGGKTEKIFIFEDILVRLIKNETDLILYPLEYLWIEEVDPNDFNVSVINFEQKLTFTLKPESKNIFLNELKTKIEKTVKNTNKVENEEKRRFCKVRLSDKTFYMGETQLAKFEGKGKIEKNGIVIYSGNFKNGKKHGKLSHFNEQGSVIYTGEWFEDKKSGMGELFEGETPIYSGEWKNDQKNGLGKMYFSNHPSKYSSYFGLWKDDLK